MKPAPNAKPLTEAEEIEAMLPWLVAGTLSRAETARVTRYLETHPEAAAHVALARDEREAAISGNEAIAAPSTANLDRLMASVANTSQPRSIAVPSPASIWESIAGFVSSLSPKTLGMAATAAALVLVVQAATIGTLINSNSSGGYQTASGGPASATTEGVQALVSLQPGVTATVLTAALSELKAAIVDGPKAGGVYRVRIVGDKADATAIVAKLKTRTDVFAFVGPVQP